MYYGVQDLIDDWVLHLPFPLGGARPIDPCPRVVSSQLFGASIPGKALQQVQGSPRGKLIPGYGEEPK
jgi:hypothetical protein